MGEGVSRTVHCTESLAWLLECSALPEGCDVITSLPDVIEVQPKMNSAEYETWFINVVATILSKLSPEHVAIFYQTDGRYTGDDGSWLDKSLLCHLGARAAGARCVWHRIVCSAQPGNYSTSKPYFAHMLCFSVARRDAPGTPSVDVLADRGHMAWPRAMGREAANAAVRYCLRGGTNREKRERALHHAGGEIYPAGIIFDPFCGMGAVLAAANEYGADAIGLDVCMKRCKVAAAYVAAPRKLA